MVRFKMVARDVNSAPTQYRTWVVDGYPDYDGYYYTGLKSGPEPFVDVSAYAVLDGYAIVDFNWPNPSDWSLTYEVLAKTTYASHLAILDGYVYLFGGNASDMIHRAPLNNPCAWEDTGALLPGPVSGGQLAVIDGYIYIFGGFNDPLGDTLDTIYSAPVSDPLTWTNHGSLLPRRIHQSQVAVLDGYIYLVAGKEIEYASDVIMKAPISDPLNWHIDGYFPTKLYSSQLIVANNRAYMLGGLIAPDSPISNIYSSDISDMINWTLDGYLPNPSAYGQACLVGDKFYLFTPSSITGSQPYETKIYSCPAAFPAYWNTVPHNIKGNINQSALAFIYDRIFLFGGNASSLIYATNPKLKYPFTSNEVVSYGNITRTQYSAAVTTDEKFLTLGFPWWKTDYGS